MYKLIFIDFVSSLECENALGMENGLISNGQITASSEWSVYHLAIQGRLRFQATPNGNFGAWIAGTPDGNQWLQIDLNSLNTAVKRIATQGRQGYPQWVTSYSLQYGDDGVTFLYYRGQGETVDKVDYTMSNNKALSHREAPLTEVLFREILRNKKKICTN